MMPGAPLSCPVRECGEPLIQSARALTCRSGHAFDVARTGYINLLQPGDRRSLHAGDSKESVQARARLMASGVARFLLDAVVERVTGILPAGDSTVIDLGSGSGEALDAISRLRRIAGIGIDLSTSAADLAARRFPALTWIVANADRHLPILDRSVDLVLSLQGRRNPAECVRVLRPGGHVLITVPAADDLIELREQVQGERVERDRTERVLAEHADAFSLIDRTTIRQRQDLDRESLIDLLRGTYRGARFIHVDRVGALERLDVTQSSDVLVFRRLERDS